MPIWFSPFNDIIDKSMREMVHTVDAKYVIPSGMWGGSAQKFKK